MTRHDADAIILPDTPLEAVEVANETGKRYLCAHCGSEFVVTRGGDGAIMCCGEPMTRKS